MTDVTRSRTNKMVAGVCGGLSEAYGIDANVLRAIFALPLFWSLYVLFWIQLPKEEQE